MILRIFNAVARSLVRVSKRTGLTYNEVNILMYYLIIPCSWTVMLDYWLGLPITTCCLILIWSGIFFATCHSFSDWCDWCFQASVDFINWFNRWGGNYVLNSVIICVVLPLVVYVLLTWLLFWWNDIRKCDRIDFIHHGGEFVQRPA